MEPAPGTRFGAYRVERRLGAGGMGAVWEGVHEGLKKRVAIKTLHAQVAQNVDAVSRFVREGQAASRIHHPHIVDVTDVGVFEGTPYLIMEFLEGEPLSAFLERGGQLPVETIVAFALPTLDAVHAAHLAGIVHRDLKPDNVFLRKPRTGAMDPVVLDFGISKVETPEGDPRLTKTSALMGTPYYMSPEQARGAKNVDARSDQFALGLVLYEAAAGRRAIDGESVLEIVHKIALLQFEPLERVRPGLPKAFTAVVDRMLAAQPADRYPTLREAGAALLPLGDSTSRALWSRVFGEADPAAFASTIAATPETRVGTPPPKAISTFGQASRESLAPRADRSGVPWWPISFVAVALVVGGYFVWDSSNDRAAPSVASAPPSSVAVAPPVPSSVAPISTVPSEASPTATEYAIRLGTTPPGAAVALDGESIGPSPLVHELVRDGVPHVIEISHAGYVPQRIEFLDIAPMEHVTLERVPRGHHGPVVARISRMTADGLVLVTAEAAPDVTTDAPAETDTADTHATRRRPPFTHAGEPEADDGAEGANGSVIIR